MATEAAFAGKKRKASSICLGNRGDVLGSNDKRICRGDSCAKDSAVASRYSWRGGNLGRQLGDVPCFR